MARTRPRSCHEMDVIGREPAFALPELVDFKLGRPPHKIETSL
jgi:hypothetical protein